MKIKLLLSILTLSMGANVLARPLSPQEALTRTEPTQVRKIKKASASPQLVGTTYDNYGKPAIYVYTYSGREGFMLVAADDAVVPLLGYSEKGSFSLEGMPGNIDSWLSLYTEQIEAARSLPPYVAYQTRAGEMAAIGPLLNTKWDQNNPYNSECPMLNGRRCVTGCVATAMAQVMNYWKYPLVGKGSITYTPPAFDEELSLDFSTINFDWDHILDVYGKTYSSTERMAVARLMKACGYSVRMKYTAGESGAYSKDISSALINNFGYDRGVNERDRSAYSSQDDWNRMVYNEMAVTGPVIYCGQSVNGSHCFVCDGYDGNGFFHINWGWGGMSDGYFLLDELTPHEVGTGGHYGGYNLNQSIIAGVMPPVGRITLESMSIRNAADDSGNVKGWGYTYRTNNFSNILLDVTLTISGGHVAAPLICSVYEYDPDTKRNGEKVLESEFDEPLNASDGKVTCSTYVHLNNYDPEKLYNLVVSYDLKGERSVIGSLRLAASAGVGEIVVDENGLTLRQEGSAIVVEGEGAVTLDIYDTSGMAVVSAKGYGLKLDLSGLTPGLYVASARNDDGLTRTLKLLLK